MADDKKPKPGPKADPVDDLKWLVGFLIILGLAWFLSGAPERSKDQKKPFVEPAFVQTK